MKTTKKEIQLKEIRKVAKRIDELHYQIRNAPTEKLEKKLLVGYWKFLSVREDILKSSIGAQVKEVVEHTNQWYMGKTKKNEHFHPYTKTLEGLQKIHYLKPLTEKEFEETKMPEFFKKKWFKERTEYIRAGSSNIPQKVYFPNIPNRMLEYKFKKAFVEEVPIVNATAESELHNLNTFMETHNGWDKLFRNHKDDWDINLVKKKKIRRLQEKEIRSTEID